MARRGGYLGAQWDAFKVYNTEGRAGNLTARVKPERLDQRLDDLQVVEQNFARRRWPQLDEKTTLHNHTIDKALRMMRSDQINAFDVTQAPVATRDGFGKTPFGNACLAAVQLIETGVRCVELPSMAGIPTPITTPLWPSKTPFWTPLSPV